MDEENVCSSSSWRKMTISKSSDEWISKEESANGEGLKIDSTNIPISDQPLPYVKIKVEREDDPSDMQQTEDFSLNFQDPLLEETKVRKLSVDSKDSQPKRETDEARATRLAKMSAYAAHRLANESPEQRAIRLKRMSEYASKRLAQETIEQRARRLARMSEYAARRLASETLEQRQARLAKMSAYAAKRKTRRKMPNTTSLGTHNKESDEV